MKLWNTCITGLAIVGVVVCVLAVNRMDYEICVGSVYPLVDTIKTMLCGCVLCIPAVVRRTYGKKFT